VLDLEVSVEHFYLLSHLPFAALLVHHLASKAERTSS